MSEEKEIKELFKTKHVKDFGSDLLKKIYNDEDLKVIFDENGVELRLVENKKSPYGFSSQSRGSGDKEWQYSGYGHSGACSMISALLIQLQTAKEENERLRNLLGKPYKRRIDLENNKLTQQNKQLREESEIMKTELISNGCIYIQGIGYLKGCE